MVEPRMEINLISFEGKAFACIPLNSTNTEKQRILLVSKDQIIESIPNPSKNGMAVVHEVHELSGLASIKFSRGQYGIIVLQFKSGKSLQYKVKDAGVFADYIKNAMINMGINGKVTKSKSALKNITSAEELLIKTKDLEAMFSVYPSFDLIQELVDVLRDAVERFDAANDERYMDAIKLVQLFLSRDDVIKILDKKNNNTTNNNNNSNSETKHNNTNNESSTIDNIDNQNISIEILPDKDISKESKISNNEDLNNSNSTIHINIDNYKDFDLNTTIDLVHVDSIDSVDNFLSPNRKKEFFDNDNGNDDLEELNNMLGNMTQEFDDMISSFSNNNHYNVDLHSNIDIDNIEDLDDILKLDIFPEMK